MVVRKTRPSRSPTRNRYSGTWQCGPVRCIRLAQNLPRDRPHVFPGLVIARAHRFRSKRRTARERASGTFLRPCRGRPEGWRILLVSCLHKLAPVRASAGGPLGSGVAIGVPNMSGETVSGSGGAVAGRGCWPRRRPLFPPEIRAAVRLWRIASCGDGIVPWTFSNEMRFPVSKWLFDPGGSPANHAREGSLGEDPRPAISLWRSFLHSCSLSRNRRNSYPP